MFLKYIIYKFKFSRIYSMWHKMKYGYGFYTGTSRKGYSYKHFREVRTSLMGVNKDRLGRNRKI